VTDFYNFTFEGGLNEYFEDSVAPEGAAVQMQNWVPEPNGVARARRAWQDTSETGAPATNKGRGIAVVNFAATYSIPTLVQKVEDTDNSSTSTSATWTNPTLEGSLLIAVASGFKNGGTMGAPTTPSGWTLLTSKVSAVDGDIAIYMYYIVNSAERSGAESITWNQTMDHLNLSLWEWSGMAIASVTDVSANNTGNTTTTLATGTTAATGQTYELWFGAVAQRGEGALGHIPTFSAPTNGFTLDEHLSAALTTTGVNTSYMNTGALYKTTTTTGTADSAVTSTRNTEHVGLIATFKAAATANSNSSYVAVHGDSTNEYELYYTESLSAGTWTAIETVTLASGTNALPLAMARGLDYFVYTHPTMTVARRWDKTAVSDATNVPLARGLAFHLSRFWAGGTTADPTKLSFSDLGSVTSWTATNFFYVGRADGEVIEDLLVIENGLLVGKRNSLWFMSGSTTDDFRLDKLNAGGCAPGRSLCATPYGAVIAGMEQVWLWSGGAPQLISRPIEENYEVTGNFVTTTCVDNKVFICDNGSAKVWVYNLETEAWHTEQRGGTAGSGVGVVSGYAGSLLMSQPLSSSALSLLQYREVDGPRERDEGTPTNFLLKTPEVWLGSAIAPITPRRLILRLRQRGGDDSDAGIVITPYYNGVAASTRTVTPETSAQVFRTAVSLGQSAGVYSVQFLLSQTNTTSDDALMDIEELIFEYQQQTARP
jgi:hypothetical protein